MEFKSPIPLRWSALKWKIREWKEDRKLRTPKGRRDYLQAIREESRDMCLTNLLRNVWQLEGDVMECGVFRGKSLLRLATTMSDAGSSKALFGLDSFGGFPVNSVRSIDVPLGRLRGRVESKFRYVEHVPNRIMKLCETFGFQNVELVPGYFEDTIEKFTNRKLCFVHLDVDLYSSYQTCLNALYDSVVPGGYIVFDEYEEKYWPGATNAIDEFFADKAEKPTFAGEHYLKPKFYIQKGSSERDLSVTKAA